MCSAMPKTMSMSCSMNSSASPRSVLQALEQRHHRLGFAVGHAGGRLVEQQQARVEAERQRDLDDALVAVSELARDVIGEPGQASRLHELLDLLAHLAARGGTKPGARVPAGGGLDAQAEIFEDGEVAEDLGDLEGADDAEPGTLLRREPVDAGALEPDRAAARRREAGDEMEERGLAGAVRTDHGMELARADLERDTVDRPDAAEVLRDLIETQQAHVGFGRRCRYPSSPRGKSSTTTTKIRPMKLIQFTVRVLR